MNYSSSCQNMCGDSSTHLKGDPDSATDSSDIKRSLGNTSVLKELHSNLGPMSSKAALSNLKLLSSSPSKSSITAAGSACLTTSENNSENEYEKHQHATKSHMDNSDVNKLSNKFIGLAEFDETKIPELPDDLNPNIEEQYNVTFEKCFVPTLKLHQDSTVPQQSSNDTTHFLLPSEVNTISSDNETFSDCNDERDPLATTFVEPSSLNVTTDLELYQSAVNNSMNSNFNNTMDNIAEMTLELEKGGQTEVVEECPDAHKQPQIDPVDDYEPMDVDMNVTMEMPIVENKTEANSSSEAISPSFPMKTFETQNAGFPRSPKAQSQTQFKCPFLEKSDYIENLEAQAKEKPSSNSSNGNLVEPGKAEDEVIRRRTFAVVNSTEDQVENIGELRSSPQACSLEALDRDQEATDKRTTYNTNSNENDSRSPKAQSEQQLKFPFVEKSENLGNVEVQVKEKESSNNSNGKLEEPEKAENCVSSRRTFGVANSTEDQVENIVGLRTKPQTLSLDDQDNDQKATDKRCTFNANTNENVSRSLKAQSEQQFKSPFLEKSENLANLEDKPKDEQSSNKSNGKLEEPERAENEVSRRRTFGVVNPTEDQVENAVGLRTKPQTLSLDDPDKDQKATDKRRTFNANTNENDSHSPKAQSEQQLKPPFLENSENLANVEVQANEEQSSNNSNGKMEKPERAENEVSRRRTFAVVNPTEDQVENIAELRNSLDAHNKDQNAAAKRRTFSVQPNENDTNASVQFPATTDQIGNSSFTYTTEHQYEINLKPENVLPTSNTDKNPRRTFNLNEFITNASEFPLESEAKPRRTFNLNEIVTHSTEQRRLDASFEPMDVDESVSQNTTMSWPENVEPSPQISPSPVIQQKSRSPAKSQSPTPPLEVTDTKSQSPTNSFEGNECTSVPFIAKSPSPPLPTMQHKSESSPPSAEKTGPESPSLPARQPKQQSSSPPLPNSQQNQTTTPEGTVQPVDSIKEEKISPSACFESNGALLASQPLSTLIQKRPSIRDARARAADILSAKEQTNIKVKDEKDVVVETSTPSPIEEVFTAVSATSTTLSNSSQLSEFNQTSSSEFGGNNNLILNSSDFDYLLTKGNNNTPVDRSSLLLKFDPLLGVPVPVNQGQPPQLRPLQIPTNTNNPYLSPTLEEDEHNDSNRSFVIDTKPEASAKLLRERVQEVRQHLQLEQQIQHNKQQITQEVNKKNATMSVDVIKDMSLDNDCNKTYENSNLKTEDIEKKLKDAEQREEALIKRITEKDKSLAKMTGVIEAYEKTIAELIADKEQLTQNYEKQLAEMKADRDLNYHHLTSLETTFSNLHVKYEKSKEMTCQLKENEEALQAENRKILEHLRLQEQRYDKMKNHAMQQLEIANKKLESLTREHSIEITKLKALLKKEEIARSSINEQLAHKTKENAELVKICDELISGQGSNFSFEPFDPKKH